MSVFKLFHRGRFPKLPTFRPLACRVPNHEGSLTHHCEPAPACAAWSLGALRWLASWPEHPLRVVPSLLIGGAQLIEPTDGRKWTSATLDARFWFLCFYFFLSQNRTKPGTSSQPPGPVEAPGSVNLWSIYLLYPQNRHKAPWRDVVAGPQHRTAGSSLAAFRLLPAKWVAPLPPGKLGYRESFLGAQSSLPLPASR